MVSEKVTENRELAEIQIDAPDETLRAQVQTRIDQIAKPLDSLGKFETYLAQIGAVTGTVAIDIRKKAVLVMCADNGIVEEGVSQCGQEVTRQVAESMGRGTSNVCKMAKVVGADVIPVDVGIAEAATFGDTGAASSSGTATSAEAIAGVLNRKVMPGTKNFRKEPAMSEEQALAAIRVGMDLAAECKEKGYQILATGEMGIGNTTTAAAVTAALTGAPSERIVGRGAGLSNVGLACKRTVVQEALEKYGFTTSEPALVGQDEDIKDNIARRRTLQILSCVGGLDIAAMAGIFIGGALVHLPVVIDGVISAVAALAAENLVPGVKAYMIPSHKSKEPAADVVFQALGMEPVIQGNLALGEGTGAVMLFGLLDLAMALYEKPTTFEDIAVEQYQRF
ncbi:MAG: nicotinate-nucleotide--dimethylbenzimidazole phosphoribosyltransferase [Lachnospiraceae bacterium]|nr:nicotinate-nucleotide--dimethylbenzimidazole phosphoribosyltransferase [Lachnospiraceae bacterium]